MKNFRNKNIILAPYSSITKRLALYLEKKLNIKVVGYIDANAVGENIYKVDDLKTLNFDDIFIFSPNHFNAIYKKLKQYLDKKHIYKIDLVSSQIDLINNEYVIYNSNQILYQDIKNKYTPTYTRLKKYFFEFGSSLVNIFKIKREYDVFICEDFIDANMKHLFLYYIRNNQKAVLLTNNLKQMNELKSHDLPVSELFSLRGYIYTILAKTIYLDHFIIDYLEYISKSQVIIQLWHGVGPKPMQDRSKFSYTYFSSPSEWINETVSKKIFKANKYLNFGYPRNDILLKQEESLDLLLCDMNIYNNIHIDRKNNMKVILYMPTFRENGFDSFPLNFSTLNESLKKEKVKFYVKLHPYVLQNYRDTIKEETYSNIIFYNTQGDVYPILKYVDILITDYSSIAYDFLHINKPIIFFNYDFLEYKEVRERSSEKKFLLDYEKDTPGKKVQTQKELVNEIINIIRNEDLYIEDRIKARQKFYDYSDSNSCSRIFNYMNSDNKEV